MTDWIITIPKRTKWSDYEKELEAVEADPDMELHFRTPFRSTAQPGDRCFVVHDGKVRGWMEVSGVTHIDEDGFECEITGHRWPGGHYIKRKGKFHKVDGPEMKGFQGIRRYNGGN